MKNIDYWSPYLLIKCLLKPLNSSMSIKEKKKKSGSWRFSYILKRFDDFFHVNKLAIIRLVRKIHIDTPDVVYRHCESADSSPRSGIIGVINFDVVETLTLLSFLVYVIVRKKSTVQTSATKIPNILPFSRRFLERVDWFGLHCWAYIVWADRSLRAHFNERCVGLILY